MDIEEKVDKLYLDMYVGEGKENPSMTTRLDRVEVSMAKMDKLQWIIIAGILAAIGDIIQQHLQHFK